MPDPTISIVAPLLRAASKPVFKHALRLYKERQAGQGVANSKSIDVTLNETLERLQGGSIDDSWWRKVWLQYNQAYIAPDFLKQPSLQEWLADEQVAEDLKSLAKEKILMGETGNNPETHSRLAESYSDHTGESSDLADDLIDVVVAILVAGYIASVPSDLRPLAGLMQESNVQINTRFDHLEEIVLPGVATTNTHPVITNYAEQELSNILSVRIYDAKCARKIQKLLKRVVDGDLAGASASTKTNIRHWTAKICAIETETLSDAKQLRNEIEQTDSDIDLTVVDALIADTEGDTDKALRLLRDPNDQDSRSAWFSLLSRVKGKADALAWFEHDNRNDPQFFTPFGWAKWAIYACENEKWDEALARLATMEDSWDKMPWLADVEGRINAAMLLPSDYRKMVFGGVPLYPGVTPNQDATAVNHHARAMACMEFVKKRIQSLSDDKWTKEFADWSLWLGLMNPRIDSANIARENIRHLMDQDAQAVDAILFAFAFEISFNTEPLKNYLEQRRTLGGLDDRELRAEFFLAWQSMIPRDFKTYIEENKIRLLDVVSPPFLTAVHATTLVEVNHSTKDARTLVEEDGTLNQDQSDRLFTMLDGSTGHDLGQKLMDRYHQSNSFIDLQNLIYHLKMVGDRERLLPLVRERFDQAPTVENAIDVVGCLGDPSSYDHQSIIKFLDGNSDILEQSNDLRAVQATALFHAGQFEDSRNVNNNLLHQRVTDNDLFLDLRIAIASGDWERIGAILDCAWNQRDSYNPDTLISFAQLAGQQGQMHNQSLQLAKLAVEKASDDPRILMAAIRQHIKLGSRGRSRPSMVRACSHSLF